MKLVGAQRMVLQAVLDAQDNTGGFASDTQVARASQISLGEVRDWLETLEGDGLVIVIRNCRDRCDDNGPGEAGTWSISTFPVASIRVDRERGRHDRI